MFLSRSRDLISQVTSNVGSGLIIYWKWAPPSIFDVLNPRDWSNHLNQCNRPLVVPAVPYILLLVLWKLVITGVTNWICWPVFTPRAHMLSPWPVSHVLVTTHTDSHASSSALVTRLLLSRDSGDFWSPQRALSLTQVWSSSWSPTLTANITLMDPCFLIIRCTVHFLEPFLLYFSFY